MVNDMADTNDLINRGEAILAVSERIRQIGLDNDPHVLSIRQVIRDLPSAQQWHVIEKRPMTEDERKEWLERLGDDIEYWDIYIYSNLPDDGQAVLVSTQYGRVYLDIFHQDDGCYFEANGDMDGIIAWMPLPKPLKESD